MTETTIDKAAPAVDGQLPAWVKTKFGAWVHDYTVLDLLADLRDRKNEVTYSAVYYWLRGETVPRPQIALCLVEIADGALSLDDVYAHAGEMKSRKKQ